MVHPCAGSDVYFDRIAAVGQTDALGNAEIVGCISLKIRAIVNVSVFCEEILHKAVVVLGRVS